MEGIEVRCPGCGSAVLRAQREAGSQLAFACFVCGRTWRQPVVPAGGPPRPPRPTATAGEATPWRRPLGPPRLAATDPGR